MQSKTIINKNERTTELVTDLETSVDENGRNPS